MPDTYRFLVDGRIPVLKTHYEPRPGPAVIVLHGLHANADSNRWELDTLAQWGLAAVGVDAPHHGARHDGWLEEMGRLGYPDFQARLLHGVREWAHDVSRVIDHVAHEGHWPIGVAGISFGAYTALTVAANDSRVQATVSILGSPDWTPREGPITEELHWLMGHAPVHRPWDCARNPLLLLNAGRDTVVPPHGSRDFAHRIWQWHPGLHVEHFEYPESEHMMRQQDWDDVWRRAPGFLRRHLYRE